MLTACRSDAARNNQLPPIVTENPHNVSRALSNLMQKRPNLNMILVILPAAGSDVRLDVKHFGDVVEGIPTQCLVSLSFFSS